MKKTTVINSLVICFLSS